MVKICPHLKPILEHEILLGNTIAEVSEGWSIAKLVISMRKKLDIEYAKTIIASGVNLRIWENHDNHYLLERGLLCKKISH